MKKWKRILGFLLCIALTISLYGCESNKLKEAKACVDELYEYTLKKADAEIELEDCTVSQRINVLKVQIDNYEELIELSTKSFSKIYEELSEKERNKIDDYIDEAARRHLATIWEN